MRRFHLALPRSIEDCLKLLAERGPEPLAVLRSAEDDELRPVVHPREMAQQISDVGADAEIVQLARVDADPHRYMILRGSGGSGW